MRDRLCSAWRRLRRWLDVPSIVDPVDRRNAPMLQLVLVLLGTLPPLLWLFRIVAVDLPWRAGETTALLLSLAISASALSTMALVRAGRFQLAVRLLLAVVAIVMLVSYASAGLEAQTFEQPIQVMWLFVAGVMVGRRALWAMFAALVLAMALGAVTDANASGDLKLLLGDVTIRAVMFLIISVVIDRSVRALRTSLDEATAAAAASAAAHARLADEVVAREQAQLRVLHAQRVEAVGRMASGVAHDFNHLLALMLGYTEQARMAATGESRTAALQGLETALDRARVTTGKLLQFARDDVRHIQRFDAVQAIRDAEPMLRQTLGRRTALKISLPDAPAPIAFDPAQFSLVLLNLAANAAQAMPTGGTFEVSARVSDARELQLSLRDTGHGMDGTTLARVLEPFFTTRPPGQGTGLGLPAVDGLVRDAGGHVAIESAPGAGTTIVITLPLAEAPADAGTSSYQTSA